MSRVPLYQFDDLKSANIMVNGRNPRLGGARILSLDDGGIRCLSSLFILRQLMEDIRNRLQLEIVPEPWQHFDLICGSGFGGLLAIMLGRLHLVRPRKYLDL